MRPIFSWHGVCVTIVFTMFAQKGSSSPGPADFDIIIQDGTVYDGSGVEPRQADVVIRGDRIVGVGDLKAAKAKAVIDAQGLAAARGQIHMLSWCTVRLT